MEIPGIFFYGKYIFSNCKRYVGPRINSLMSISDVLGPFICCRKTEKERPMREEMDAKIV